MPRRAAFRSRIVFVVAVLFALLVQSVVTQSHLHPESLVRQSIQASAGGISAGIELGRRPSQKSGDCLICREIAQAGQYVASNPPRIADISSQPFLIAPVAIQAAALRTLSHAWRSRGPPQIAAS